MLDQSKNNMVYFVIAAIGISSVRLLTALSGCSFPFTGSSLSQVESSARNLPFLNQKISKIRFAISVVPFILPRRLTLFAHNSPEEQYLNANAFTNSVFEPDSATNFVNTVLYPPSEMKARFGAGAVSQQFKPGEVLSPSDPRLTLTYEEFPLHSFEMLIDRTNELRTINPAGKSPIDTLVTTEVNTPTKQRIKLVDLGSGAGRLVIYAALIKGGSSGWDVHGVEISAELHLVAHKILERAIAHDLFTGSTSTDNDRMLGDKHKIGSVYLHLGSAKLCASRGLLDDADIIFCYSTALPAPDFCVEWGAPMLSLEWSELLSTSCAKGCLVITTDRVLNPRHGWLLLDKMDVDNPALFGSVGYIHFLDRKPV